MENPLFDEFAFIPARGLRRSSKVRRVSNKLKGPRLPAGAATQSPVPAATGSTQTAGKGQRQRRGAGLRRPAKNRTSPHGEPAAKAPKPKKQSKSVPKPPPVSSTGPLPAFTPVLVEELQEQSAPRLVSLPVEREELLSFPGEPTERQHRGRRRLGAALLAGVLVAGGATMYVLNSSNKSEPSVRVIPKVTSRAKPAAVKPTAFHYAFRAGETRSYQLKMTAQTGTKGADNFASTTVTALLGLRVTDVAEDGSAIAELSLDEIKVTPSTEEPPAPGTTTIRIGPDGRVTSAKGSEALIGGRDFSKSGGTVGTSEDPAAAIGAQFLFPQLPSDAVKAGDEWTKDSPILVPDSDQTIVVHSSGRLDGFDGSGPARVAKVHQSAAAPIESTVGSEKVTTTMEWTTDSLVVPSTGEVKSMTGTIKQSVSGSASTADQLTTSFTLVREADSASA